MPDRVVAFGPGRVNVVGEHTDYNDGLCLPFALDRGVRVVAERRDGQRLEAVARDAGEEDAFDVRDPQPADGWRAFVRGVVAELRRDGVTVSSTFNLDRTVDTYHALYRDVIGAAKAA